MLFCHLLKFLQNQLYQKFFQDVCVQVLAYSVILHAFLSSSEVLQINFFQKIIPGLSVSHSLDPDQARQNVGPDLGPNCWQRLSTEDTSRQRIKPVVCNNITK